MAGVAPGGAAWVRVVFRRRVFIIAALAVQLLFILSLIAGSRLFFRYLDLALQGLSVAVSLYILNKKGKAGYKLTWIFLIMLFPIFGGIVYVFFHTQGTPRRLLRRMRDAGRRYNALFTLPGDRLPLIAAAHEDCLPQVRYLQEYAGFPVYTNTRTAYFPSGEAFFHRALEELEKAEKYVFLEFFILRQGVMLDPIIDILARKARAGLDVRIIYDDLGCFMSLPPEFRRSLEKKGIRCLVFNPFRPLLSSLQNNRDHRKILCVDGKVAFTGGVNLADEYINARERFGHWKDAAVMVEGEAAWSFALIFLTMWNIIQGSRDQDDPRRFYPGSFPAPPGAAGEGFVLPYADSPIDDENVGEHVYLQIINNAKQYVYISTPYLVPDENLISALTLAAKSGVDIRIITPHLWDKRVVAITSRSYYRRLIQAGVRVYEYSDGFNHSKTFVSDDKVATVGTVNLDFRSLYLHFECGLWMYRARAVAEVKADFLATLERSREITLKDCARNAAQRVAQDVLRVFAPLM